MAPDQRIRVLIVDDSAVIRRLLSEGLASDPALQVAGTAENGRVGLAKIEELDPDVVLLDLEMPVLDGLGTLEILRQTRPKLPVIVFSSLTTRGATATLDALARGADRVLHVPRPEFIEVLGDRSDRALARFKSDAVRKERERLAHVDELASECHAKCERAEDPSVSLEKIEALVTSFRDELEAKKADVEDKGHRLGSYIRHLQEAIKHLTTIYAAHKHGSAEG